MTDNLKKQAEHLARQMAENLYRNDQNRDRVDEADFQRSRQAEAGKPAIPPSPFKDRGKKP